VEGVGIRDWIWSFKFIINNNSRGRQGLMLCKFSLEETFSCKESKAEEKVNGSCSNQSM
jgi:hypothetical protein